MSQSGRRPIHGKFERWDITPFDTTPSGLIRSEAQGTFKQNDSKISLIVNIARGIDSSSKGKHMTCNTNPHPANSQKVDHGL